MNNDNNNLDLLGTFHYVVGGVCALFSCLPLIHLAIGLMMLFGALPMHRAEAQVPGMLVGVFFVVIPLVIITIGVVLAVLIIKAGTCLKQRRSYTFCQVMAGISCVFMPFGTVLGVFTLIELNKPEVKALFAAAKSSEAGNIPA